MVRNTAYFQHPALLQMYIFHQYIMYSEFRSCVKVEVAVQGFPS